jgi:hypothetical protein
MRSNNVIPPMTHEMGAHWSQPRTIDMTITDTQVVMKKKDFELLKEYSRSLPSGVYHGKMWKCHAKDGWYLCWYGEHIDPNKVSINTRVIILQELLDLITNPSE